MELSDEENERRDASLSGDEGGFRSDEAEEEPSGQNEDEDGEGIARRIDPATSKKKVIRNPQPKLNAERIQGPKGIQTIEKYFEGFKFHGKGHEKADLDRVMKRLEHWAHRLFPKYGFDDFLEKMEALGSKKNIQVYLKKYRLGMIETDNDAIIDNENDADREQPMAESEPVDEFDKLIAEQIEKQRLVSNESPRQVNKQTSSVLGSASTAKPSEFSDEVKARIEANRKLALERKMARLRREEEAKKNKLQESQVDSQDSNTIDVFGTKESETIVEEVRNEESAAEVVPQEEYVRNVEEEMEASDERISNEASVKEGNKKDTPDSLNEQIPREVERELEIMEEENIISNRDITSIDKLIEENHEEAKDVEEIPVYQLQDNDLPTVIDENCEASNKEPDKLLSHEELLMEIDGAMEEIINKSTRRST